MITSDKKLRNRSVKTRDRLGNEVINIFKFNCKNENSIVLLGCMTRPSSFAPLQLGFCQTTRWTSNDTSLCLTSFLHLWHWRWRYQNIADYVKIENALLAFFPYAFFLLAFCPDNQFSNSHSFRRLEIVLTTLSRL